MKKISCLFVALMLVALLGCTAMAENIATVWTLTTMSYQGKTENEVDGDKSIVYYLNEDGTGTVYAGIGEENIGSNDFTWSQNGNIVTLTVDGDSVDFTLVDGTLVGEVDGVTLTLASGTPGLVAFNGSWVCNNASFQGQTIPLSNINTELTMSMHGGTGEMWMKMEGTEYLSTVTGEMKEVVVAEGEAPVEAMVVTAENKDLFSDVINMVYMEDGTIHFVEPSSGVTFILEKVAD